MINTNFRTLTPPQVRQNKQSQVGFGQAFLKKHPEILDNIDRNTNELVVKAHENAIPGVVMGIASLGTAVARSVGIPARLGPSTYSVIKQGCGGSSSFRNNLEATKPVAAIPKAVVIAADKIEDAGIATGKAAIEGLSNYIDWLNNSGGTGPF